MGPFVPLIYAYILYCSMYTFTTFVKMESLAGDQSLPINYVQLSEGIKNFVIDSYIRYNKVVTKVFARHILFEMSFKFDHHFCVHNNSLNTLLDLLTLFMFKSRPDGSLMDH